MGQIVGPFHDGSRGKREMQGGESGERAMGLFHSFQQTDIMCLIPIPVATCPSFGFVGTLLAFNELLSDRP